MISVPAARLLLCAALLLVLGCSSPSNDYYPLNTGWRWTYDIHVKTMDGQQHKKFIVENIGTVTHEGRTLYLRGSAEGAVSYYQLTAAGIVRAGESYPEQGTKMFENPSPVLPATIAKGARWTQAEFTVALEHTGPPEHSLNRITVPVELHYVIEETDETVITPSGTFTGCIRAKGTGETSKDVGFYVGQTDIRVENTAWYQRGVGLVKAIRVETTTSPMLPRGSYEMMLSQFERR